MKTITLNISYQNEDDRNFVQKESLVYFSIVRYAFNRFQEKRLSKKEIYQDCAGKFSLNSHLLNSAIREAYGIFQRFKDKTLCFGHFRRYVKGLISKKEYRKSRSRGIFSEGEAIHKGNRMFQIDMDSMEIIYKQAIRHHIHLKISQHVSPRRMQTLRQIQLAMSERKCPISIRLKDDAISISYEEKIIEEYRQFRNLDKRRIMGLDLNPNFIGVSVLKFHKDDSFNVILRQCFDLTALQEKGSANKARYELQQIAHKLMTTCRHYHVGKLSIEDLHSLKPKNQHKGRNFNRLVNNKWRKSQFISHLKTLCSTFGVELVEVNPAYSSIIGNLQYGSEKCPDMVASSIEIARRGYHKFQKGWIYPAINKAKVKESLRNLWKEEVDGKSLAWKSIFGKIKESRLRYRFQLASENAVFRQEYLKGLMVLNTFNAT